MERIVLNVHSSELTGGCRIEGGECSALDTQVTTLEQLGLSDEAIDKNIALITANCTKLGRCSLVRIEGGSQNA